MILPTHLLEFLIVEIDSNCHCWSYIEIKFESHEILVVKFRLYVIHVGIKVGGVGIKLD